MIPSCTGWQPRWGRFWEPQVPMVGTQKHLPLLTEWSQGPDVPHPGAPHHLNEESEILQRWKAAKSVLRWKVPQY